MLPLGVIVIGMFMSVLNTTSVNVALARMSADLGASTEDIQWVSTAYNLCLGVVVPASAWLGDRLGLKRLYLASLVGFCVGSVLCGLAGDLTSMIFFRIVQAAPGGMLPVTCMTILYRIVPRRQIGTAMGLYGLGMVVAPAVGPTLGGYLVEYASWRLVFFVNVPVGLIGLAAGAFVLPKLAGRPGRRFDGVGFACVAGGLFALLLAASEGADWGWTGYRVLLLVTVGVLLLALFVVIELEVTDPLLDVRALRNLAMVNSLVLIALMSIGLFAVSFYVPVFLQEGQGLTALNTGFVLLPQGLVMMVCMPLAGRISDRFGARWPAVFGLAVSGIGLLMLCNVNPDMTRGEFIAALMFRAVGPGVAMMPITTSGISALPAHLSGAGSAMNQLVQRVSAALGLALLTAMSTGQQAQLMADRSALLQAADDPRLQEMAARGTEGLAPLYQALRLDVLAQAYSDVFLVSGTVTLAAIPLALLIRSPRSPR
ncbi:DHA2 family efflux MFS transporter permease subunit [Pseudonocardia eucalypti]|uniref:DHA2 family efflux MFS transporter permease subunit n=1 Tax=Pseudonocardia eucalypti TaxID=648755 RepID=A0ABP9PID1_9PSEU|nr:EmrB/QacA subfamily drug resistance transporter [Pseudonocardia eucalypti]